MSRFGSIFHIVASAILIILLAVPSAAFAQDDSDNERISLDPVSLDVAADDDAAGDDGEWLPDLIEDVNENTDESDDAYLDSNTHSDSLVKGHGFQLSMAFIGLPSAIFNGWFAEHGSLWSGGAVNMGFSVDYFLRFKAPCEMRFSLSWVNARTSSAYWLDKNYENRPHLADYIENNHSIVSLEVGAFHVISIIDEIAFYYGGGLWGGIILDDSKSYAIRSDCANHTDDLSQCPHEPGSTPLTQMPKGIGTLFVALGFKFTLWDVMTIRAEGGFKGYFYGQLGLGVEF